MTTIGRIRAELLAAGRSFLRRRTAVFFTFFFPVILVVIFGVLIRTRPTGGGLFAEPPAYYLAGYLAVVVLFTPLSRVGSEVARHREGARFEKLATTPLTRSEWLVAHVVVNVGVIGLASLGILVLVVALTGATIHVDPGLLLVGPFVAVGVVLFGAVGALLGRLADSQDGVVAASNALALPLLFLSETFVTREMLPEWLPTWLSPLTYFARGVRAVTTTSGRPMPPGVGMGIDPTTWAALSNLVVLAVVAGGIFLLAAHVIPTTD